MHDNPNKRGRQDRSRTSRQKHEQAYRRKRGGASRRSKSRSSVGSRAGNGNGRAGDALALLRADHRKVQVMFDAFESARSKPRKAELAKEICAELKVHAQIEEEIFYPALRVALRAHDLLDEALVEHASAKALIAQIEDARPGAGLFDAEVTVLGEYIKHHIKEEQNEIFPKARKASMDLAALGERLAARKAELQAAADQ